jgi:hypothetical protein
MSQAQLIPSSPLGDAPADPVRRLARELVVGSGYWLAFLLVLEPGNILGALAHGGLDWRSEAMRIAAGALLGGAVTPLLLALARRFPVEGARPWVNLAWLAGADLVLSAVLIVVGCLLARLGLRHDPRPLFTALAEELAGNGPLLVFCIAAFLALAHAARRRRGLVAAAHAPPAARVFRERVAVRTRTGVELVDLARVDWIETQGNYLALHGGTSVWLVRETSAAFEAELDPARFARIHRRTLVALDRVRAVTPLGAGDALVRLADGTELRMSRSYRDGVAALFAGPRAGEAQNSAS